MAGPVRRIRGASSRPRPDRRRPSASAATRTSGSRSTASFSALWTGQLIWLFGDRVHQFALAALVARDDRLAVAVGVRSSSPPLPNLLLSPVAGTFVDRWDRKEVMIVSDLLRAAVVLLIPIAVTVNIYSSTR